MKSSLTQEEPGFHLSPKAGGKEQCPSSKSVDRRSSLSLVVGSDFVPFRPSSDWVRPTHTGEGNLLIQMWILSKSSLTHIPRIVSNQIPGPPLAQSNRHITLTVTNVALEVGQMVMWKSTWWFFHWILVHSVPDRLSGLRQVIQPLWFISSSVIQGMHISLWFWSAFPQWSLRWASFHVPVGHLYLFTPLRMARSRKIRNKQVLVRLWRKGNAYVLWVGWGCKLAQSLWKTV